MTTRQLLKPTLALGIAALIVVILVYAKPFLMPLTFAGLLAMLLLPLVKWLQKKKVPHVLAILLAMFTLVAFFAGIILFTSLQMASIGQDSAKLEQQVTKKYNSVRQYIEQVFNISQEKQKQLIEKQQSSGSGKTGSFVTGFLTGLFGFLTNAVLTLVYIFLFLFFRRKLKGFIVKMVPPARAEDALKTVNEAQKVSQQYLTGLFLMIVCLWIMYTIGFTIAGVKNALFFAIICGLLEIVPFVGNLIGTALTLSMSLVQGGGSNVLIGILVTYVLVQFIQSYLLEPLIVGAEVQINPLFTIIGLVAGEVLWGIPGMVLAIPMLGITKIICEHVPPLKPYAYLIGNEKKEDTGVKKKVKTFFKNAAAALKKKK
ncbi:AI-2E family transporter [Longitalea arenae]|uniref:AI-2E family transporter n=1 Tax=Longitalea arenae TaxID=2812558 RepID=UPI0019682734|nr:AI-2E family transporter [Longitalea arenae]